MKKSLRVELKQPENAIAMLDRDLSARLEEVAKSMVRVMDGLLGTTVPMGGRSHWVFAHSLTTKHLAVCDIQMAAFGQGTYPFRLHDVEGLQFTERNLVLAFSHPIEPLVFDQAVSVADAVIAPSFSEEHVRVANQTGVYLHVVTAQQEEPLSVTIKLILTQPGLLRTTEICMPRQAAFA